ncbi:MAG: hypothetical protein JXR03_13680 [Cyclobacteriaceae bacterium]
MKNIIKTLLLVIVIGFTSCRENEDLSNAQGDVTFSFEVSGNDTPSGGRVVSTTAAASKIVVTIESTGGTVVYSQEELNVIEFNGSYISEPISLEVGSYMLTEYFVIDDAGSTIYATPLEGSELAYLVNDPLPIDFSITADGSSKVTPEVLSTADVPSVDFGYVDFSFAIVETFDFLMSVHVFDEATASYALTDANVIVSSNGVELYNKTIAAATDQIRVLDGYASYEISVSKDGFDSNTTSLDNATIKGHLNDPLEVILVAEKGVINIGAYEGCLGNSIAVAQSFVATSHGEVSSLGLNMCSAYSGTTVTLYEGEGIGGTVVATQNIGLSFYANSIALDPGFELVKDQTYTFGFSVGNYQSGYANTNPYVDGQMYINGEASLGNDMQLDIFY